MNEQFRVAQKLGLMFRPETHLPNDVKNWAISQLKAKSPALGISQIGSKVKPWPQSLSPTYWPETLCLVTGSKEVK